MTIRFNTATRNVMADALAGILGAATLNVYTGSQPASANNAPTGTLLISFDVASVGYNTASNGSATMADSVQATAVASGTAGWARFSDGICVVDGTVGTSGTDFIISTTSITNGGVVTLNTATVTQPAS